MIFGVKMFNYFLCFDYDFSFRSPVLSAKLTLGLVAQCAGWEKKKHIPAVGGVYISYIFSLKDWIASHPRNDEDE